ncbi:MAG TPA: UGSC family (seleno)protein [Stellaceae bacterium]|nr:UGSC family (seleno)protein [Stellaceae bacterium]
MALEQQGVPSIAVHTHVFARLVKATAQANGMPTTRQVFVPQPVVDKSASELRAYIEGVDPVTKRPFMQEVLEGLTHPLDETDLKGLSFERSTPRLLSPDSEETLRQLFIDNHWTDYLPIVLPTEERVAAMLKGTSHPPDKVVGRMSPTSFREYWEYTVEKVAVNAVMAGAKPEYFPVILALAATGFTAKSSSTTSMTNIAVVNGPIRHELGMNCGIGAMGPYSHANVTIGRAYQLLSQNLQGGSVPDETYMGTLGNPLAYSFCFAENEERSPWEPLHVSKGMKPTDNAVSVFMGARYMQEGYGPRETWEEKMRRCLAAGEHFPPLLVMDPIVARLFAGKGVTTRQQLVEWCANNARLPAREYWDEQWVQTLLHPLAVAGVEPYATRLKAKPDEIVRMFEAKEINVVVTGGETQGAWKIFGARHQTTVPIDPWR